MASKAGVGLEAWAGTGGGAYGSGEWGATWVDRGAGGDRWATRGLEEDSVCLGRTAGVYAVGAGAGAGADEALGMGKGFVELRCTAKGDPWR